MENWLNRVELLIGKQAIGKLQNSTVVVFGCGGVGSYAIEGLVRSGIGHLIIIDHDVIDVTNINRQIMADTTTIGKAKVEVMKERVLKINPNIDIQVYQEFANFSNLDTFIPMNCSYMIDAIDTVKSKLDLVAYANIHHIPIISCMGTGNKLNPNMFEITDISKTSVCPLAKVMRKELKNRGIYHLKVLYSKEEPHRFSDEVLFKRIPANISFVPSVAGLMIAGEVVKKLIT